MFLHIFHKCFLLEVDEENNIIYWALCNDNCPQEEIPSVCMNPPETPSFSNSMRDNLESTLFLSSWFDLKISESDSLYKLSADRKRRHQPKWKYDSSNLTDYIAVYAKNNTVDLHDIYSIFHENDTINYTCPEEHIFDHSNILYFSLTCTNGSWNSSNFFNTSKFCTRKYLI